MKTSNLTFLFLTFLFGSISLSAQTKAVDNLKKSIYPGKIDGIKTVKTYSYNTSNGDISNNVLNGGFYRMTVHERDEEGRALYDLSVKVSGEKIDTSYGNRYQYENKNGLPFKQYMYPKWPNSKQYTLVTIKYTNLEQIESKETIVTNSDGDVKSYQKITYRYDKLKRVIQERDSSTSRCTSKFCDQIVSNYYYDTLGVKCYIEESKVRNADDKMLMSKTFLTDSIGKVNRKYYYNGYGNLNYERSEYVEFDKRQHVVRRHSYQIKRNNWAERPIVDSVMIINNYTTYNGKNQLVYYEDKIEKSYIKYVYNDKKQLVERSGKNTFVALKEFFKYDLNGNIIEYIEDRNGNISKSTYTDYNKFGIAETIKNYDDSGQVSHITKHEFIGF